MPTTYAKIAYTYDANGQRASASVTPPGGGAASVVDDYYQWGRLAYQTTGSGTLLARYTYDLTGVPVSVQVGSDPTTAPRYYYVYDARGDVVNLTDATGATVASYAYDTWGKLTASSESIPNAGGWVNPYRYDGRDRVLADPTTGLDWLATRAYDPSTGRFLARDPLGRAPLYFADNPYAYAGNNPLSNVDPSGQYRAAGHGSAARESGAATNAMMAKVVARVVAQHGTPSKGSGSVGCGGCKVKTATAGCGKTCMDFMYGKLETLSAAIDPLGSLGGILGISIASGALGAAGGIVLAIEKLADAWLIGATFATMFSGIALALAINESVVSQYMATKISGVMGDITHDEADGTQFDLTEYTNLINNLHTATLVTGIVDGVGAAASIIGTVALALSTGGTGVEAASAFGMGLGFGFFLGTMLMIYINSEVNDYDRQIRAGM